MDGGMFRGLEELINGLIVVAVISVPLALWKVVEIIIWAFERLTV